MQTFRFDVRDQGCKAEGNRGRKLLPGMGVYNRETLFLLGLSILALDDVRQYLSLRNSMLPRQRP